MVDVSAVAATATITAICGGVVGAVVAAIVAGLSKAGGKARTGDRAMKDGMSALLWREIKNIHTDAEARGGMTTEERRHLERVYGAYAGLGCNGTGKRMYEDSMSMDII